MIETDSEAALHRAFAAQPPVPSASPPLAKKQSVVTTQAAPTPSPASAAKRKILGNSSTAPREIPERDGYLE